ncbi:MAG TPA: hypothetical protein VGI39_35960 [Polyangiaceae bacterium]|jgi:hypothetical protein
MTLDSHRWKAAALATLVTAGGALGCAHGAPPPSAPLATTAGNPSGHEHDWEWLVGRWKVRHHRLKERLTGCTQWEDFAGTSALWLTMGGLGTIDDNVLELPSGTYRAMGARVFDPADGQWRIWWFDGRTPDHLEPPVKGGFKDGEGTFFADDTLRGKPIKVRFRWTKITPTSAHWEQAFSPDGGATWEVNWEMEFQRDG